LAWASPGNATGYNVKSSTNSTSPFTVIATNIGALSYTNTGLANGNTYYYVVSGVNSAGESPNSAAISAQPISFAPPVFNFALNAGQIQLNWGQDHTGWTLQAQTNPLGTGIGTNWVSISQSALTNQFTLPFDSVDGSVFFRLVYP
jgi:cellulose 1,4-beta-cellobiosidase